jgi:transposase
MRRRTTASEIILTDEERGVLERLGRRRKVSRGEAQRAEIVLRAADGMNNCEIADAVGVTRQTVRTWRERFAIDRLDGLDDEPRCGAPRKIGDDRIEAIVVKTLEAKPADATHWSTRGMAKASGVSVSTVHRIWKAFSLQPHRAETFKLSTDPQFIEKVRDRTQPVLPIRMGQVERRTHDDDRHGTTTFFAGVIEAVTAL